MPNTSFPGGSVAAGAVLALVALAGSLAPAPGARAAASGTPPRILIDGGALRTWDGAATDLQPLPKWITVRLGAPLATLTLRDGRLVLILGKAEETEGRGHHKRDGAALLLGWPGGGPADLGYHSQFTVSFEGTPLYATGTEEHAWVYASEGTASPGVTVRAWVHDIDFHAGRVADSTFLLGTVRGLAIQPDGSRLFAGVDDRVLSLTTRPLVTSWHYRSPGPNGPLAISPDGRVLAALRGASLALFDAAEIAGRTAAERRDRVDDATHAVALERPARGLAFSDDGRMVAVFGADRVEFFDTGSGARLGEERVPGLGESAELRPLLFSGNGSDIVVAALPSGAVAALPCPEPATRRTASPVAAVAALPEAAAPPAATPSGAPPAPPVIPATPEPQPARPDPATAASAETHATSPEAGPGKAGLEPGASAAAPPAAASSAVAAPAAASSAAASRPSEAHPAESTSTATRPPDAHPAEAPATEGPATEGPATDSRAAETPAAGPPTLSGHIGGTAGIVRTIAIYGPGSIIREYWRTKVDTDGSWSMPLPPPGNYRVVPVGDGSTPIPVRPGFLSIVVEAGKPVGGLDFKAGAAE